MNYRSFIKRSSCALHLTILLVISMTGCSEKKVESSTITTPTEQLQPQATTPQAITHTPVAVERRVADVQQAVKVKDYDRALETLWSPQPASNPITPEQAAKLNAAMTQLQGQLAAAAAAGDPKAIAARERLRLRSLQMP